jgi:succinate dehydrogenase/fumarate reductase flavoprotein subunit
MNKKAPAVNRRDFLKKSTAIGVGATAAPGQDRGGARAGQIRFDQVADVVIAGAGAAGLPAAIMARNQGASVIVIDANHDIGGHAMLSGGRIPLGGGTSLQKKYGIADSADQVYLDPTNHRNPEFRHADRDLVRVWADENVATFEFLIENGVVFNDEPPSIVNGGGPIWAIFDSNAVKREGWDPNPPNVDPRGWFFAAETITELAGKIVNQYQSQPIAAGVLETTVAKYNSFVEVQKDSDFGKPTPKYAIKSPPFYAAWSTPILHDTLTGLKINRKCQVIDVHGQVIPGLYCAGESAGGFALHGLPRVTVFGRIAGREAASV